MNDLKLVFFSISQGTLSWQLHGNQFCGQNLGPILRIGFVCDSLGGGVGQKVQVLRWTQANQLTITKKAARG